LTPRQKHFVKELCNPENRSYVAAYRKAYSPSPDSLPKTVRDNASRLRRHSGVIAALDVARAELERVRAREAVATRQAIRVRLWEEIDATDTPSASRVAALRLLGLESGMFAERAKVEVSEPLPESEADLVAELEARLREALPVPTSANALQGSSPEVSALGDSEDAPPPPLESDALTGDY